MIFALKTIVFNKVNADLPQFMDQLKGNKLAVDGRSNHRFLNEKSQVPYFQTIKYKVVAGRVISVR